MTGSDLTHILQLPNEADTVGFADLCAQFLRPGDCLALIGDIGAGKTTFARALIRASLGPAGATEDIPSPSFTLVQSYDTARGAIWHADLYRLSDPDEVFELGLEAAFDSAICLIEWPDRLGPDLPSEALTLEFIAAKDDSRTLRLSWSDPSWTDRLVPVITGFNNEMPDA
ncbi:MAG: tRNA (adenosine(37)-N6)-threonylcarbamoyltransferase complex ATPase subunit type 1 TsaE [Mangrovicoccus sp.]